MSEGRTPEPPGGDRQLFELVLGSIALAALALAAVGVMRARRWALRREGKRRWRTGLRLAPALLPAAVLAAYPDLLSFLMNGRTVTWEQLTYFPAPMSITLLVTALAGVLVTAVRVCVLCKLTRYTKQRSSRAHDRDRRSLRMARLADRHRVAADVPAQRPEGR